MTEPSKKTKKTSRAKEGSKYSTLVEFNGQNVTPYKWQEITGIPHQTIASRIARGWTPERALTTPVDPRFSQYKAVKSKNDAELELNDCPYDNLPSTVQKFIKEWGGKGKKYGQIFRNCGRKQFDKWFDEEFLRETNTTPPTFE